MGAVWQAHDDILGRSVAIKQLLLQPGLEEAESEEARQRTMREGRIAARLHHPNAITVFDVVTDEHGQPCLIMEYLESTSLAEELQAKKTLPPVEVARIGQQIAAALKAAHRVGIVHRDIKPGNILLTDEGVVKLTDFGISRAKDDVSVTKTGMIAGTPAYLAPEVAIGQDPGPESDIFSLGSTLYAATEGQPPFGLSQNTLSLLHAVAAGHINPPRQSGPLTSLLAVLLHPDKERRPDAAGAEELLAAVARGEVPLGGPVEEHADAEDDGTTLLAAGAAGAAGGAALSADEGATALAGGHSGTLADFANPADGYPDQGHADYEDDLDDRGYAPAAGYPGAEYGDDDATRMVAAADLPRDSEDDERSAGWRKPAVVGGLVLAAVAALGIWVFTSSGDQDKKSEQPPPVVTSSSSEPPETTTTTTTTTTKPSPVEEPVQPPPTTEEPSEPPPTTEEPPPTTEEPPPTTTEPPPTTTEPSSEPSEPPSSDTSVSPASP